MTSPNDPTAATPAGGAYPRTEAFGKYTSSPRFPELEEKVLDFWSQDETFQASIDQRDGAPEYVFYDGPPFANGLPHYGHLLTGYVKDIVPRYQTMAGYQVRRVFGWDCHGCPPSWRPKSSCGITDKGQIEEMGLARSLTTTVPRPCCATPASGKSTSPARLGGLTLTMATKPWTPTSWSRSSGPSRSSMTRA